MEIGTSDGLCGANAWGEVWGVAGSLSGNLYFAHVNGDSGLSVSTNGGTSFTCKTSSDGILNDRIYDVAEDSGGKIYLSTMGGITASSNAGGAFTNYTTADGLGGNSISNTFIVGTNVYAMTSGGLSISLDGGSTFANKKRSDGIGGVSDSVNNVFVDGSGKIYVPTSDGISIGVQVN